MSENGGKHEQEAASEVGRLVAIIEMCAVQAERSFEASQGAKRAAERSEKGVADIMRVVRKLADNQLEMQSGLPASWRDRFMLVAMTAAVAATVAAIVVRFAG